MKSRNLKTFSSVAPTGAGTSYTGYGLIYVQTLKFDLVDKETQAESTTDTFPNPSSGPAHSAISVREKHPSSRPLSRER